MPYEEEEDRVCEVKCPKGGGVCGIGSTPILLPFIFQLGITIDGSDQMSSFSLFQGASTAKGGEGRLGGPTYVRTCQMVHLLKQ